MEAVSGVAAILQLAYALGTTVRKVSQAYSQITCMDDLLRDFDAQLDATRTVLSIFDDGIRNANFISNTDGWWRQSELERLLRNCHQHYERLNDIFNKIARQRSSAPALRAWIRSKRYDHDIAHLRLCINTCTNALQLPLILHGIQSNVPVPSEAYGPSSATVLIGDVAYRLTKVETSIDRTRDAIVKRTSHEHTEDATATSQFDTTGHMIKNLNLNISTLDTSYHAQSSTAGPSETEALLARMQTTISKLRTEIGDKGKGHEVAFNAQEIKRRQQMEEDTRSMLVIMDDLADTTKGCISTFDSVSTAPDSLPWTSQASEIQSAEISRGNSSMSPKLPFVPPQDFGDKVESVEEWIDNIDTDDETIPISDLSGFHSLSPAATAATTPATQSALTTTSRKSFRDEIRQRRIRAVDDMMKMRSYGKASDLLELLLSDTSGTGDCQEQCRLYHYMAEAIAFGEGNTNQEIYARFPPLESMVTKARHDLKLKTDKANLTEATEALARGDYDSVLDILGEYQRRFTDLRKTAGLSISERKMTQKIQIAYGQSLLYSRAFWDIAESIRVMEALLKDDSLGRSDSAIAHQTLAIAYQLKSDYVKSKFHGEEAYRIMQDLGRDDEEIWKLIELMVRICAESEDPDEEFWSEMIPERVAALNRDVKSPFIPREGLDTCSASQRLEHIHQVLGADRALPTSVGNLDSQYSVPEHGPMMLHNILCWDCLKRYFLGNPTVDGRLDQDSSCQRHQVHGNMTRGFSIMHFFAIAQPIASDNALYPDHKKKTIPTEITDNVCLSGFRKMTACKLSSNAPDCVDEISILLRNAKRNREDDVSWARLMPIDTGDFRMHDLVNRPMDFQPPEHLRGASKTIVITPVWAAAMSGRLSTVLFFLSLRETDVTRGSESVFLLQRPASGTSSQSKSKHQPFRERLKTKRNLKWDTLKRTAGSTPEESDETDFQRVLQSVWEVFNALPQKVARQLVSCIWRPEYHWAFVDSSFLSKLLDKCGEGSADLRIRCPVQNCPKPPSKSILTLFLNLMALGYVERLPWAEAQDLKNMLRTLLDHSQETVSDTSFKDQSMAILIDHIRNAAENLIGTRSLKPHSASATIENFNLWIDMLAMYMDRGHNLSIGNRIRLQGCISHLGYCEERLVHIRDWESAHGETTERLTHWRPHWSFISQFKEPDIETLKKENKDRTNELMQKKTLLAKEKDMLEGGIVIRDRLKELM